MKIYKAMLAVLMLFTLAGCGSKKEETDHSVETILVQTPSGKEVRDLFDYTSVEQTNITDFAEMDDNLKEGVYCVGKLSNDDSILWYLDEQEVFLYIDANVPSTSIVSYVNDLAGNPISYNEFLKRGKVDGSDILYNGNSQSDSNYDELIHYLNNEEYELIIDYYENNPGLLNDVYYQNNEVVDSLKDGKAAIIQNNGIYYGDVKNGERSGQGIQLGIYLGDYSWTVSTGTWENDALNGEATYYEPDITVDSSMMEQDVDFTYQGHFTDNYYDGEIRATWTTPSGTYTGTFYASMGNLTTIRVEGDRHIYLDNGNGYYWYFTDATALQGWKVWDGRAGK